MGYINVTQGVTLQVPTAGTRNWASNLLSNAWNKLSSHDHTGSGKGLQIVTAAIANLAVTSAKLAKNLALGQATTVVQVGDAATLNLDNGNTQTLDLTAGTGTVTISLSNPQAGATYRIFILQDATLVQDIVWPGSVLWAQGEKYGSAVSQATSAVDCVTLYYNGTSYFGDWQLSWQ